MFRFIFLVIKSPDPDSLEIWIQIRIRAHNTVPPKVFARSGSRYQFSSNKWPPFDHCPVLLCLDINSSFVESIKIPCEAVGV
jgi:hypothetical protein